MMAKDACGRRTQPSARRMEPCDAATGRATALRSGGKVDQDMRRDVNAVGGNRW
jgi:hypothetical protein